MNKIYAATVTYTSDSCRNNNMIKMDILTAITSVNMTRQQWCINNTAVPM